MSSAPILREFPGLRLLSKRLREELDNKDVILLYAYNRTGKTRLSMDFKDLGKKKTSKSPEGTPDTLYFNAFTEDLFTWENDLDGDSSRYLRFNKESRFFDAMAELALDKAIYDRLSRYADFDFDIDYKRWTVSFRKDEATEIKISRGEQNLFIWCLFMAICQTVIDGHESYSWVKYLYIDDPISSLDDNNAIAVACDLAKLLREAASRKHGDGSPAPIKTVFSSHHALFYNVMCNEIDRTRDDSPKPKIGRRFMYRPNGAPETYALQATDSTPFFHHVAVLAELQRAANPDTGTLYTFHFNAMRSIMEKTAAFFGHSDISFCLTALNSEDASARYNRALNLLSHGAYSISEPTEMGEDTKALFREILNGFVEEFQFSIPSIFDATGSIKALKAPQAASR